MFGDFAYRRASLLGIMDVMDVMGLEMSLPTVILG